MAYRWNSGATLTNLRYRYGDRSRIHPSLIITAISKCYRTPIGFLYQ
ncbi:MAG: hypothetical protein HC862_06085 [Scytonema sp. RU_4_4]|nr:hypothetical protein [Scytonema sp. RU_4_4]NJR74240.1 hypothetical protein [Scytonema sp. CRU_2_7]